MQVVGVACFLTPLVLGALLALAGSKSQRLKALGVNLLGFMLIAGSLVLIAEHAYHGEVTLHPPFLTSMTQADSSIILHEVGAIGGSMTIAVATLWATITWLPRLVASVRSSRVYEAVWKCGR